MSRTPDVTLRPATDADRPFLLEVYAESRADEVAATGWSDQEKADFLDGQFTLQDAFYREHYPDCQYLIVEGAGRPVGRLYVDRRSDEIRVVDIALLASERGKGVGGQLMQEILDEASLAEIPVRIHAERTNPARRLYDRLGFALEEEGEVYDLLVWINPV